MRNICAKRQAEVISRLGLQPKRCTNTEPGWGAAPAIKAAVCAVNHGAGKVAPPRCVDSASSENPRYLAGAAGPNYRACDLVFPPVLVGARFEEFLTAPRIARAGS